MNNNPSLGDFYISDEFQKNEDKLACVQTSILKFYLTAYTGKRLKCNRLNQSEISKQINKLKKIIVDSETFNIEQHLDKVRQGALMYGKTNQQIQSDVSYAKRFFKFVEQQLQPPVISPPEDSNNLTLQYTEAIMDKSEFIPETKKHQEKIILSHKPSDYLEELRQVHSHLSDSQLLSLSKKEVDRIFGIIQKFELYYTKKLGNNANSFKCTKDYLLRYIGWIKKYKDLTIEELKIEDILPIINPYVDLNDFDSIEQIEEIAIGEWKLKYKIKEITKKFKKVLEEFLATYGANWSLSTTEKQISTIINFAEYLYKDITDDEDNNDYQDISLIKKLRIIRQDLRNEGNNFCPKIIPFNWNEILQIMYRLKKEADQNHGYDATHKNYQGKKLTKIQKSIHLRDFLMVAFFCVIPPDRQRTFRELKFGETLKYGLRDAQRGIFTPYDKLKKGQKPKYYIHLLPDQYKTGKKYGIFWWEINNQNFEDGTTFYDYINMWLFESYRDELANKKTDYFFIARCGDAFAEVERGRFTHCFKFIINRKTRFPLNPHALRHIYITHVRNLGLSDNELKAIAYAMHHDKATADAIYNRQTPDDKIKLAVEFINQQSILPNIT